MKASAFTLVILAAMTPVAQPALAAVNMLSNGSFESNGASWTNANGTFTTAAAAGVSVDPFTTAAGSPDAAGTKVYTQTASSPTVTTLTQSINLVRGTNYSVGYDIVLYNNANAGTFTSSVTIGDATLSGLTVASSSLTALTWAEKIVTFTATTTGAANFVYTFTSGASTKSAAIDRVYVTNIPEPSSVLLLIGGAAGLLGMRFRRR